MEGQHVKHFIPYILMSIFTWGAYVPCMHAAGKALKSPARSYLLVCVAYFLVGVGTLVWMLIKGISISPAVWQPKGSWLALLGGTLGAVGALGIVLAVIKAAEMKISPAPIAPLVFCGAPIVATLIGMYLQRANIQWNSIDWRFFLGIVMTAGGTAMIMYFSPKAH